MARNASATRSPSGTSPTSVVGSPRRRHPSRTCKRCLFSNSESADGALDAYGIGLDPTSLDLARSYQLDVWDRIGSCTLTGARHDDGSHHLTVVTPHSQTRHLAPALDRDQRSAAFGPPTPLAWEAGGAGSR